MTSSGDASGGVTSPVTLSCPIPAGYLIFAAVAAVPEFQPALPRRHGDETIPYRDETILRFPRKCSETAALYWSSQRSAETARQGAQTEARNRGTTMFILDALRRNSRRAAAFGVLALRSTAFSCAATAAPLPLFPFIL